VRFASPLPLLDPRPALVVEKWKVLTRAVDLFPSSLSFFVYPDFLDPVVPKALLFRTTRPAYSRFFFHLSAFTEPFFLFKVSLSLFFPRAWVGFFVARNHAFALEESASGHPYLRTDFPPPSRLSPVPFFITKVIIHDSCVKRRRALNRPLPCPSPSLIRNRVNQGSLCSLSPLCFFFFFFFSILPCCERDTSRPRCYLCVFNIATCPAMTIRDVRLL